MERYTALSGGEDVNIPSTIEVTDPASGDLFTEVAAGRTEELDASVAEAHAARGRGASTPPSARSRLLGRLRELIMDHRPLGAELESRATGKPLRQALADAEVSARYVEFYGGVLETVTGDTHGGISESPHLHSGPAFRRNRPYHAVELSTSDRCSYSGARLRRGQLRRHEASGGHTIGPHRAGPPGPRSRIPSGRTQRGVRHRQKGRRRIRLAPEALPICPSPAHRKLAVPKPLRPSRTTFPSCSSWAASHRTSFSAMLAWIGPSSSSAPRSCRTPARPARQPPGCSLSVPSTTG